jgi:predicted DNA-binding transcriptional regulator YafY
LRSAIQERQLVRLNYHAYRRPGAEWRDVEPTSLVYFGQTWHLAGYCRLRQAPRLFRLERIDRLELLGERFELGPRHEQPGPRDTWKASAVEARVRFEPTVERWVRERQPFTFVREEVDAAGSIFVYGLRDDADGLLSWLLAWGEAVTVLDPPELRARLVAVARTLLERHQVVPEAPDRLLSGALA